MPRLPRVSIENILYYITSRGIKEQKLFNDEKDYYAYLELLSKSKKENDFKLFAFTLLPNHLHLLIELKSGANISEIMQNLNNSYTKYYNSRYKKKGPVFFQRFKAAYVEKALYLLKLTKHIHLNAVKLKLADIPQEYPYSSCRFYLNPDCMSNTLRSGFPDIAADVQEVFAHIQEKDKQIAYGNFIITPEDKRAGTLHKILNRGGFLGSDEFIDRIKQEIQIRSEEKKDKAIEEIVKPILTRRNLFIWTGLIIILILGTISFYLYTENWTQIQMYETRLQKDRSLQLRLIQEMQDMEKRLRSKVASYKKPNDLENTIWEIKLSSITQQDLELTDRVSFREGKFSSYRLSLEGYGNSNYSMETRDDGTIIWETMQLGPDGRTASWYGEWKGEIMSGMLSQYSKGGERQDFSFISMIKK